MVPNSIGRISCVSLPTKLCCAVALFFYFAAAASAFDRISVNPKEFGAIGNGIDDDWPAFQKAIDRVANNTTGGKVVVSEPAAGGAWRLSQALRMRSFVTLQVVNPRTRILCMGEPPAVWPANGCVLFGNYTAHRLSEVKPYPLVRAVAGDRSVTLGKDVIVPEFSHGDLILVASASTFRVGKGADAYEVPTFLQVNLVERFDVIDGKIDLRFPLKETLPTGVVRKLNEKVGSRSDSPLPLWGTYQARVLGGTWEAAADKAIPFSAAGGALECTISPYAVSAFTGVGYGNMLARCHIEATREHVSGIAVELAFGSHDNTVTIGHVNMDAWPSNTKDKPPWSIGLDEAAHDNNVIIGNLQLRAEDFDVIRVNRATRNHVQVGNVSGQFIAGYVVRIENSGFAGAPPESALNVINIKESRIAFQKGYVAVNANQSNQVDGHFYGAIGRSPTQKSIGIK